MGANSYVCRSYRGKTGREGLFAPPPASWIGLIIECGSSWMLGQTGNWPCFLKCGWWEISSPGRPQIYFLLISLIEFFKWNLDLKNLKNYQHLFLEKQVLPFIIRRKKCQFTWINVLVENRLHGEFYWPNVFHYGFKIQLLTWALHRFLKFTAS